CEAPEILGFYLTQRRENTILIDSSNRNTEDFDDFWIENLFCTEIACKFVCKANPRIVLCKIPIIVKFREQRVVKNIIDDAV
uniref:Uncharacterized protein n=1 Tax=Romanomermis culicivorax TaxID=13658 RepID=A0A915KHT5_ROMCU